MGGAGVAEIRIADEHAEHATEPDEVAQRRRDIELEIAGERDDLLLRLGAVVELELFEWIAGDRREVVEDEARAEQDDDENPESTGYVGKHDPRSP